MIKYSIKKKEDCKLWINFKSYTLVVCVDDKDQHVWLTTGAHIVRLTGGKEQVAYGTVDPWNSAYWRVFRGKLTLENE